MTPLQRKLNTAVGTTILGLQMCFMLLSKYGASFFFLHSFFLLFVAYSTYTEFILQKIVSYLLLYHIQLAII